MFVGPGHRIVVQEATAQGRATPVSDPSVYSQKNRSQSLLRDISYQSNIEIEPAGADTSCTLNVIETVNELNGIPLRHRSYNGGLTGPTIRVNRGQTLRVHLRNMLSPERGGPHSSNEPHGFNTTNLHTHGLHVSPKQPADDVFLEISPGNDFRYVFEIPADHHPGTFWYHAHKHGSTAVQLASGMAGALIIPGGLDEVPAIRAAEEKVMVLQQFIYREIQGEPAYVDPELVYSGTGDIVEAINGVVTPTIVMRPGEVQRWRLIHAGTTEAIFLDIEGINFYEIAVDGLATGKIIQKDSIELYPGYRSDVLVKAPLSAGTRLMNSAIPEASESIRGQVLDSHSLLRVVIQGDPKPMELPTEDDLAPLAAYNQTDVPRDDEIDNEREIRFEIDGDRFLVNGESFDPDSIAQSIRLGSAEQWRIVSVNGIHPFHIHVNPFAVRREGSDDPWVWRDTIAVRRRRPVILRTRYQRFDGKTVLHCHNLDHEDRGMMQAIEILPEEEVPSTESVRHTSSDLDSPVAKIDATLFGQLPRWCAETPEGKRIDSDHFSGKPYLLVLHRGMSCIHCAQQLAILDHHIERFNKAGLSVVAISQSLPEDADSLEAIKEFRFPVLSDPPMSVFEGLDCVTSEGVPRHGLFLINASEGIVFQHQSEDAVLDTKELVHETIKLHLLEMGN